MVFWVGAQSQRLSQPELASWRSNRHRSDADWPAGTVFTVGHSTLPIERFFAVLAAFGIERLADVRTVPRSRRNPQFNADALAASLRGVAIEYVPLRELGGLRKPRTDSPNTGWRNESFRGTRITCRPSRSAKVSRGSSSCHASGAWRHVRRGRAVAVSSLAGRRRARRPRHSVVEILSETSFRDHALTPFARVAARDHLPARAKPAALTG